MANENSRPQAQTIPLAKIHDLPGVFISKQPDKTYGGLVTSIQAGGVKEPVILRLREDGEYQLVTGYRRRRASELAKKQDIPALVYEMTLQEAASYHRRVQSNPNLPVPGKLLVPPSQDGKTQNPDIKGTENPTAGSHDAGKPAAPAVEDKSKEAPVPAGPAKGDKPPEVKPGEKPAAPTAEDKPKEAPAPVAPVKDGKAPEVKPGEKPAAPTAEDKPKEAPAPVGPAKDGKAPEVKPGEKPAAPTAEDKPKEAPAPAGPAKDDKAPEVKTGEKPAAPAVGDKPKEAVKPIIAGPAAKGPAGTAISQVLDERLSPPDEKELKDLPAPKEGESFFVTLNPAYLKTSKYNTISVDRQSEDYKELKKSIELNGVKDPVLARIGDEGTLEIISGQRRHIIATELNYPVPTIIQKISDADAKILVADGNLHRPHISAYDLSRSLRMKMEGMKQMQYTIYNAIGKEPSAWRDGKPLASVQLTIDQADEPYTQTFWPWRSSELEKLVHGRPNSHYYVEAWDYYSKGIFQYTRYCVASL